MMATAACVFGVLVYRDQIYQIDSLVSQAKVQENGEVSLLPSLLPSSSDPDTYQKIPLGQWSGWR